MDLQSPAHSVLTSNALVLLEWPDAGSGRFHTGVKLHEGGCGTGED